MNTPYTWIVLGVSLVLICTMALVKAPTPNRGIGQRSFIAIMLLAGIVCATCGLFLKIIQ